MANERPRRFTAEQARHFLSQLLEDQPSDNVTSFDSDWPGEKENDRSRSRYSSTGSHRSHPSPRSTSSGELDDSTVSSRSSPNVEQSTSAARPRGRPRRQNVVVPRQQQQEVDNWRQVTTGDGGRGTSKRIRFVPTKQPGRYCLISTIYTPNQRKFSMHEGNGYKII